MSSAGVAWVRQAVAGIDETARVVYVTRWSGHPSRAISTGSGSMAPA
jgi:hypothetical protein